jgi:type IV secretory pathway VirB2 component (pilin)
MFRIFSILLILGFGFTANASAGCGEDGFYLSVYNGKSECIKCDDKSVLVADTSNKEAPSVVCIPKEVSKDITSCNKANGTCIDSSGVVNIDKFKDPMVQVNKSLSQVAFASTVKQGSSSEEVKKFLSFSEQEKNALVAKTLSNNNPADDSQIIGGAKSKLSGINDNAVTLSAGTTAPTGVIGFTNAKTILCNFATILQGKLGTGIATIAIFILGITAFMGKLSWVNVFIVAFSIVIMFGAVQFAEIIAGIVNIDSRFKC